MIISFPPAIGGGKRRDFYYFGTRPYNFAIPVITSLINTAKSRGIDKYYSV
ncbi:MAG: hypothetical protein LBR79_02870 [Oscillospiraceae bacterium]|nr:hypothetical protein [Oscillospiraceae bacterium]